MRTAGERVAADWPNFQNEDGRGLTLIDIDNLQLT